MDKLPNGPIDLALIPNRSLRLTAINAPREYVGVLELWVYDRNTNVDYMHSGLVTMASFSYVQDPGYEPYKAEYTFDGITANWQSSAYLKRDPTREKYLQYNFSVDIDPWTWTILTEGSWFPYDNGLELHLYTARGWINITGTLNQVITGYNKQFTYII